MWLGEIDFSDRLVKIEEEEEDKKVLLMAHVMNKFGS
jgi:hypothetical protein